MAKQIYTKVSHHTSTIETPFIVLDGMQYSLRTSNNSFQKAVTGDGEEIIFMKSNNTVEIYKDTNPYRKIFKSNISTFKDLSIPGYKVLAYVLDNLPINDELICIVPSELVDYCGYQTTKNIYVGILDLLNNEFISRKAGADSCYWVNPNKIFNGDRTKLLEASCRHEYVKALKRIAKNTNSDLKP